MDEDLRVFRKKLDLVTDLSRTGEVNMVDFIYADPFKFGQQYGALWERREHMEAIIHCSAVPGKGDRVRSDYATRMMRHRLSLFGFDTVTYKVGKGTGGYFAKLPDGTGGVGDVQPYRWSYPGLSMEMAGNRWEASDREHAFCDCPLCRGMDQSEIVDIHTRRIDGTADPLGMSRASLIHDALSSVPEMEDRRNTIRNRETKEREELTEERRELFLNTIKFGRVREYKTPK